VTLGMQDKECRTKECRTKECRTDGSDPNATVSELLRRAFL
jgi:hypothetical protein